MHYLIAVIQGIVEGLTEFLPVSSTGHLILTGSLLHFTGEKASSFEIIIQLGAILAVVVVFWKRLFGLIGLNKEMRGDSNHLNLLHIFLAMLPAGILGLLLNDYILKYLFSPTTVLIGLVVGGFLMIYAQKSHRPIVTDTLDTVSYRQAFFIGLFQCLALWPGFSRSGATISGGLLVGTNYKISAEFSFIVAVPIMVAASGLDLIKTYHSLSTSDIPFFAVGFIVSFIVALLAIVSFLKLVNKVKLVPFAYYRFIIAAIFAIYLYFA